MTSWLLDVVVDGWNFMPPLRYPTETVIVSGANLSMHFLRSLGDYRKIHRWIPLALRQAQGKRHHDIVVFGRCCGRVELHASAKTSRSNCHSERSEPIYAFSEKSR